MRRCHSAGVLVRCWLDSGGCVASLQRWTSCVLLWSRYFTVCPGGSQGQFGSIFQHANCCYTHAQDHALQASKQAVELSHARQRNLACD